MNAPTANVVRGHAPAHAGSARPSARFLVLLAVLIIAKIVLVSVALPALSEQIRSLYAFGHNPDGYDSLAANLANGIGYRVYEDTNPTMFREPGYVVALAGIFAVFGDSALVARLFNVLFSLLSAWLLWRTGRLLGIPARAIKIGVVLLLVHPAMLFAESRLGIEALLSLLIMASLYTMLRAIENRSIAAFALAGLVAALTALTRSAVIPVFAVWAVYVLILARREGWLEPAACGLGVFALCATVVFSVWPVRNYLLSGQPIVSSTVSGDAMFIGMYLSARADEDKEHHDLIRDAGSARVEILTAAGVPPMRGFYFHTTIEEELRHQQVLLETALAAYRAEPTLWLRTIARNVTAFWVQGKTRLATALNGVLSTVTLALALAGLMLGLRAGHRLALVPLSIVVYQAIHLPIVATARYHVVLIPLLMLLCGIVLAAAYRRLVLPRLSSRAGLAPTR